jgi:hypothetical protein
MAIYPSLTAPVNWRAAAVSGPRRSEIRALHVVAGLYPAHGGPSYVVPRLCQALAASGGATTLLSVAGADDGASDTSENG